MLKWIYVRRKTKDFDKTYIEKRVKSLKRKMGNGWFVSFKKIDDILLIVDYLFNNW